MSGIKISYPYPVLRPEPIDYGVAVFKDDTSVESDSEGFTIKTTFSVNDEEISQMIDSGILEYVVYIRCKTTMLRDVKRVSKDYPSIRLPAGSVHHAVEYTPYIVVKERIVGYSNRDLSEDYAGAEIDLKKGTVFGVGSTRSFQALFEKDIVNDVASAIQIVGSDKEKYMKVDLEGQKITVVLPSSQCGLYKGMRSWKKLWPLLNSVVIVPALMEAISTIYGTSEDDEEMAGRPWFISLQRAIEGLAKTTGQPESQFYEHPTWAAQVIMDGVSKDALKIIDEIK